MNTNNNISIWRGSNTPPTKFHLWLKNNKLYHFDGIDWIENKVETASYENDGLMSKEDKERLDNLVYDGLDSTDIDKALSANLGNILLNKINDLKISAYKVKGSVENFDNLPTENLEIGDVYNILNSFYIDNKKYPEGTNVVWTGSKWDPLGGTVDFKDYSTTEEINEIITNLENNISDSFDNVNNSLNNINDLLDNLSNTKADKVYTDLLLETKVDKISGKGLSTNDYTTEEKNKLEFLSNLNLSYATSELYDLSSPNHKANINEIRINLNIMGISMINSVSIIVASDSSYNGDLYMRIYDMNNNLVSTSNNSINLSLNLGQHITWYFTPFRLIKNAIYRFSAWDASGTKQTIRIHCASNKNEGVNCFDSNDSPHTDYCPAFGVNIGAIFADDLYKKILPKSDKTYVDTLLAIKVDKVQGKELSTNDYTTAEKNLVATISDKADKIYVDNKFATKANLSDVSFNANNASRIRTDDMRYMGIAFDTNDVNDGVYDTSADVANLSVGDTFDFREGYENRGNISSAMRLYIGETIVVLSSDITAILTEAGPRIMRILVKSNEDNMCVYKCNKPDCWIQIYGTGANYRIYKKPYVFGLEDLYKKVDEISSNYVDASTFISKADDLDTRKADKTYVDTQLETKANTEYINAQVEILTTALETKVNKVSGKSLSTNDYTNAEKNLVATIPSKASEEYVDENILQLAKQRTSFVTPCFSDCDTTHEAKCNSITLSGGELGFGFKSIFSVTIKIAENLSLRNYTSTYLHIKDLSGNSIGVSMNGVKQMQNLGKYATWFFDSAINTSGAPIVLSLHTTNVASSASDSNLVKIIAHVNQNEDMKACGVTDENGTYHTNWTPALGINVVNLAAIYPQIKELQKYRMAYATSELPDISTTGHKANVKEIRINQNVMGISLVNSVSIMVASDRAYSGALELRVYDINDNLIATSNNTVNLSQNLGKYVTWYFTPFQLNIDAVYRFSVWNSEASQVMRIHVASGKSEGVTCFDQNNSPHTDYCPAFGINISAIFADDLRKSIKEVNLALGNQMMELNMVTDNLSTKMTNMEANLTNIFIGLEEILAYGVEWDTEVADPHLTRIGNMSLHKTLPIQSQLKGCIAQKDKVIYWLNESDWRFKKDPEIVSMNLILNDKYLLVSDVFSTIRYERQWIKIDGIVCLLGSIYTNTNTADIIYNDQLDALGLVTGTKNVELGAVLNGYDGTVRVYCPNFYIKSEIDGTKRRVWISTVKIDDSYTHQPKILIDAYRSTVLNTVPTNMGYLSTLPVNSAISVVNEHTYCRGGGNRSANDMYIVSDPFRSDLCKPRTKLSRATMRTYSRNAGSEMLSYDLYKNIFYWLYVIEYANFNCQEAYNEALTDEGYKQGGLGAGITNMGNLSEYNGNYPLTPCGYGNEIGNGTGIKPLVIPEFTYGSGSIKAALTLSMPRWRGFDNLFGDIWTNLDGIIIQGDAEGNPKTVYTTTDPNNYGDNESAKNTMEIAGHEIDQYGYTKEFDLGEAAHIIPESLGGNTTKYKCDSHWTGPKNTSLRTLFVGGSARNGANAGLGDFSSEGGVSSSYTIIGFRSVSAFLSFSE